MCLGREVLDERPLYACKYHMAKNHWQIIRHEGQGQQRYGKVETDGASKAAGLISELI